MGFSPVEVVFGSTPILPEAEPLFHCPTTSGYGQETGKFSPTKTGKLPPTVTQSGDGYRNLPIETVIEDPFVRNSEHSYFIQIADVCAYFARQYYDPNRFVKKQGARKYYERLEPVILKEASRKHPLGIVEL